VGPEALEEALGRERKVKTVEVLNVLTGKGFKKVGKRSIDSLHKSEDLTDHYDEVIEYYKDVLRKEKEQVEEDKKKKLREVELWTRAIREEEKSAIEQHHKENPVDANTEAIKESMAKRRAAELREKQALESARGVFEAHMAEAMEGRRREWEQRRQDFKGEQMEALKGRILEHANGERRKARNDQIAKRRAEEWRIKEAKI